MSSKDDYLRNGGPVFENNPAEIDKNPDGLKPDNTDLKRTTKKTLKDYLSDKTSINQFPVDKRHDENKPDTSIYNDPDAKTTPELKINDPDVNEYQFKPQFLQKNPEIEGFKRGKLKDPTIPEQINGNDLLNYQRTDLPSSRIGQYRIQKLSANRFSDNNEYGSNIGDKTFSIRKRTKDTPNSEKQIDLSVDQLNEIASYLMLRASGKDAKPGESSMFVPGIQQLIPGTKLNGNQLNINQIVKDLFVNEEDKDILGKESGQYRDSFGVLNNYFDRFEKTSVGTLALSASIVGATIAALLVAAAPYALIVTNRNVELDYLSNNGELPEKRKLRDKLGNLNYKKPSDIIPTFEYITGIERSRFVSNNRTYFASFYAEILTGGSIFFSLNGNALALLGSFGYYINFCRSIVRDTLRIIDLFTPKNGESDLEYTDNMISYDTLQIVKNSKLTKCMNLFIKLSDLEKDSEKTRDANGLILKLTNIKNTSTELIKNYEDSIDRNKDNMPFYFRDLRNDKIIQFYATLSDFSETYSPQWSEEHYYGRVDPIKFYKSTTRKVSLNFKVFAYDKSDHIEMWKKLQDLTSLVYPTYTEKRKLSASEHYIDVPFSQTFKSQPIIRVKLGDLITNNVGDVSNFIKTTPKSGSFSYGGNIEELFDELKVDQYSESLINGLRKDELDKLKLNLKSITENDITNTPKLGEKLKFLFKNACFSKNITYFGLYKTRDGSREIENINNNLNTINNKKKSKESKHEKVQIQGKVVKKKDENFIDPLSKKSLKKEELTKIAKAKSQFDKQPPFLQGVEKVSLTNKKSDLTGQEFEQVKEESIDKPNRKILTIENQKIDDIEEIYAASGNKVNEIRIKSKKLVKLIRDQYQSLLPDLNLDVQFNTIEYVGIDIDSLEPKLIQKFPSNDISENPFYKAMEKVHGLGALAYVDSLNYKTTDGYPWETDIDYGRRPKIIDVSMELTILHDIQPFSNGELYQHRQSRNGK